MKSISKEKVKDRIKFIREREVSEKDISYLRWIHGIFIAVWVLTLYFLNVLSLTIWSKLILSIPLISAIYKLTRGSYREITSDPGFTRSPVVTLLYITFLFISFKVERKRTLRDTFFMRIMMFSFFYILSDLIDFPLRHENIYVDVHLSLIIQLATLSLIGAAVTEFIFQTMKYH